MSSVRNSSTTTPEPSGAEPLAAMSLSTARMGTSERSRRRLNASVVVIGLSALAASASAVTLMVWATVGPL